MKVVNEYRNVKEEEAAREKKCVAQTLPFHRLLSYADGLDWTLMALGTLGSIVHGLAQPVGYLLLGKALNAFGANIHDTDAMVHSLKKIVPYVWYMAFATFPAGVLEIGCWMYASQRQVSRLRLEFLTAVLRQDIGTFDTDLTSGKIILGISNHMSVIQDTIGEKLGHFLSCFATFFSGVFIAFISCWEVSLLALLVVPIIMLTGATYTKKMNSISVIKTTYLSEATAMVEQTISQIKTVFAFVGEKLAVRSFTECIERQFKISKKEALIKGFGTGMFQAITFCSWALIVWVGAVVVTAKRASGGDVIAAVMSILFGAMPEKLVLQGFSLSIPAGKVVALVGSSGCGKSTIISLAMRFYDPVKGEILLDNQNIKDLDLRFLRRNIGVVSQEPSLFSGNIMDNIRVGNMDADDQQIERAAIMANAHSFISQLPDQYLTEVGQRGFQLSGGQKQRIAIARAILKNPPILLLDEATSALDTESEKLVQDALEAAMEGRTVILIAHRVSTVVNADMIVVVEDGKVTETGKHHQLIAKSTFYNGLFTMQDISQETEKRVGHTAEENEAIEQKGSPQSTFLEDSRRNEEEEEERKDLDIFFRIWYDLKRKDVIRTAIGSLAAAFSGISKPVFGFFIITIGVAYYDSDAKQKVGWYSLVFASIGLLSWFTNTLQHYLYGVVGEKAMTNLRNSLYSATLENELAWFERSENNVGSLTSRIVNETSTVKIIISDRMSVIVQCISSIVIATTVSMRVDWRMGLVAWAVMPCHFIGGLIQAKSAKGFSGDSSAARSEVVSLASESAANIKTVVSFCHEEHVVEKARVSLQPQLHRSRKESIKFGIIQGTSLCLWNIAHAVALWYTTLLVQRNQSSFLNAIRSYQIFSLTVPSITELWTLIPTVLSAIGILKPVFKTLDRRTQIEPDKPEDSSSESIKGEVEFKTIKFHYPSRPEVMVLNRFNLRIEAGMKVALVGPSGAGKSSVIALLLRFYDVDEGQVLIDGKDVRDYNLRKLRAQIGLVQQEPLLFCCSIRENICYGSERASEAEIIEVSKAANIHTFISNLPEGYDTVVGEKGSQLSGGQKQRIAIARALLNRPAIMLLDEATSALDSGSERAVVSALESLQNHKFGRSSPSKMTQITVAHRLSTVVNSDIIVVMDKGCVVEMGSHSTLTSEPDGVYSRLVSLQSMKDH
nr:ABC transporter B family member 19-like [Ipomoea batatas]